MDTTSFWNNFGTGLTSPSTAPATNGTSSGGSGIFGTVLGDALDAYKSSQQPRSVTAPSTFSVDKLGTIITQNVKTIVIGLVAVGVAVATIVVFNSRRKKS